MCKYVPLVCVQKAELFVPYSTTFIIVQHIKYCLVVIYRQVYALSFTAVYKFLNTNRSIQIDIKGFECLPIVDKLLFYSLVDSFKDFLESHLFFYSEVPTFFLKHGIGRIVENLSLN